MQLNDPRIVTRVEQAFSFLLPYRLVNGPNPSTYNHITINLSNVLSFFLGFLAIGLLLAYASRSIEPRHKQLKGLVEVLGWGFWLVMPGMLFLVSGTPSLTYGTVYWNYLGLIWYAGLFLMWFIFADVFAFHRFYSRRLARLVPKGWKARTKLDLPMYQAWSLGS